MGAMTLYCMHQLLRCHDYYRHRFVSFSVDENVFFNPFVERREQKCDFGDVMRYTLATCRWHFLHRYAKLGKSVETIFQNAFFIRSSRLDSSSTVSHRHHAIRFLHGLFRLRSGERQTGLRSLFSTSRADSNLSTADVRRGLGILDDPKSESLSAVFLSSPTS